MSEHEFLQQRFQADRGHLRAVAYRMLGSLSEAEDAVQEAWLKLDRSDTSDVANLSGWLTTVVARVCLDMLRTRRSRREEPLEPPVAEQLASQQNAIDPEHEMLMADSVGLALLVVLEMLDPAERVAFVLHDVFDLSFEEIAPIVGRSLPAARQLASRARRRVQGASAIPDADLNRQREVVDAYIAASRAGDFDALLAVLDPNVVLRIDSAAVPAGAPTEVRGASLVAKKALAFAGRARFSRTALVNGTVGIVVAPRGQLLVVLRPTIVRGKIVEIDLITDPARFDRLDLAVLG